MVRKALMEDIPELLNLGEVMVSESPVLDEHPYSRVRVEQVVKGSIDQDACFVAEEQGSGLVGCIVGFISNWWYSDDEFVGDLATYVLPNYRRLGLAREMVEYLELFASQRCIPDVVLGISSGVQDNATTRFYESMGYVRCSTGMVKRLA